jgi:hypothetical protein
MVQAASHGAGPTTVAVNLKGGRRFTATAADGTLDPADLGDKFARLTHAALGDRGAAALFERLQRLEREDSLDWLGAGP